MNFLKLTHIKSNFSAFFMLFLALATEPSHGRQWTESATGRQVEGEYIFADGKSVTITVSGGKTVNIPLSRLSQEDQDFVRNRLTKVLQPEAPAAPTLIEDRFEDIKRLSAEKIPTAGIAHESLSRLDDEIRRFMKEKGIGAMTFALSRNGKLLHDRAYGWRDSKLSVPLTPGIRMRLASMTKPLVKAAIHTLFTENKLKPDDRVFTLLGLDQFKEAKGCDSRWEAITIQHLLDHKGGWDREKSGDFSSRCEEIAEFFGVKLNELDPLHVVRYGLTKRLDFDPGSDSAYCNYGFILLVRVIEKVSGEKFIDYLQSTVCKTAEAPSFSISASDARDRQPGEIWYCYYSEYTERQVPLKFRVEARDGAGALACVAADYCRFLDHYSITGPLRNPGPGTAGIFSGQHAGVTAVSAQRKDGINYAAIANRREREKDSWGEELRTVIDRELSRVVGSLK